MNAYAALYAATDLRRVARAALDALKDAEKHFMAVMYATQKASLAAYLAAGGDPDDFLGPIDFEQSFLPAQPEYRAAEARYEEALASYREAVQTFNAAAKVARTYWENKAHVDYCFLSY